MSLHTRIQQTRVRNLTRPEVTPVLADECRSFFCRLRGLICRTPITYDRGLLFIFDHESRLDSAIHMFGVKSDLAVVWIQHEGLVVDVRLAKRNYPAYIPKEPACYVLEMNPLRFSDFCIGERIELQVLSAMEVREKSDNNEK